MSGTTPGALAPADEVLPEPEQLWAEIDAWAVPPAAITLWWLFQAGFVVKSPGGTMLAIDPYLSDAVTRSYHQARAVPALLDPGAVRLDAVLASHSHEDHLDPDSILPFARWPATRFVGPPMVADKVVAAGVPRERTVALRRGEEVQLGDVSVRAAHARHPFAPEPVPDAVGFVVEAGPVSLYHGGDTEYDAENVADSSGVTVSLVPINGTAGNMNAYEAAMLAWRQGARLAVPMHYRLWGPGGYGEGATLDPGLFVDTYRRLAPEGRTLVLQPGRAVTVDADGNVS
jgi:L-ascorbate 6-phosphate lactonase